MIVSTISCAVINVPGAQSFIVVWGTIGIDLYIRRVIRTLMALPEPSEMSCCQCRIEQFRSCLDLLLSATKTCWVIGICGDDCDGEDLGRASTSGSNAFPPSSLEHDIREPGYVCPVIARTDEYFRDTQQRARCRNRRDYTFTKT